MPARLFLSSGDLIADRRFDFARDLQLKGDLVAAADLLLQATDWRPALPRPGSHSEKFAGGSASPTRRSRRFAKRARGSRGPARRRPAADAVGRRAAPACRRPMSGAVRPICAAIRGGAGQRSRLSRPGTAVQGGALGACRRAEACLLQARHRSRLRYRACRPRFRSPGRPLHRHRPVAAHDREGARHRTLCAARGGRHGGGPARLSRRSAELVLAADTMVYVAILHRCCARSHACWWPAACWPSRVESHGGEGVILGAGLRYAHSAAYVRASVAAAGLTLRGWKIYRRATRTTFPCPALWWSRPKPEFDLRAMTHAPEQGGIAPRAIA